MTKKTPSKPDGILKRLKEEKITRINAGWRQFTIVMEDFIEGDSDETLYGSVSFDKGTLNLNMVLLEKDDETARETILHEIMHIVLDIVGLGGAPFAHAEHEKDMHLQNEDLTTRISRGLLLFKNLNPKLSEIIFNG